MKLWTTYITTCMVISSSIVGLSLCIGITSHIDIAHRSKEYFELVSQGVDYQEILQKHDDAFQAGAPYPDAYYSGLCFGGEYHDISEDTHWTPFINVTVNYIRREYPKPWNEVNYHGSYSAAHTDGDFGGDVLNLYGLDLDYIGKVAKWYIPTEDLYNIYQDYYGEVRMPIDVIENCTALLFLGRLGENIGVVDKLYPIYAKRSPFLTDHLQDYFLGGIEDMATWSANVWRHTIYMLDEGTDACYLPENPIYISCNTIRLFKRRYKTYKRMKRALLDDVIKRPDLVYDNFISSEYSEEDISSNFVVKHTHRGLTLKPRRRLQRQMKRTARKAIRMMTLLGLDRLQGSNVTEPDHFYTSQHSYARLGETLHKGDYNGDGYMDLVIGAPGYSIPSNFQQGRVYVIYGSSKGFPAFTDDVENIANVTLSGTGMNGRFGTSLTTCDVNADGVDDLVVSAPSVGSDDLEYYGVVYIFFGSADGLQDVPDMDITCLQTYCNLGWSLASHDMNGDKMSDLLIGAPFAPAGGRQRGFVSVLLASDSYTGGESLNEEDMDWLAPGHQDYEWLGYSVTGMSDSSNTWVVAGAPTFRVCYRQDCEFNENDTQSVGRTYGFKYPQGSYSFLLSGQNEFDQFGFNLYTGNVDSLAYLFVTAATEGNTDANITQSGSVHMYLWPDVVSNITQPVAAFYGDRSYGRFGSNIMIEDFDGDSKDDLLVTAGLWSESYFDLTESGRAYVFSNIANITSEIVETSQAEETYGITQSKLRFGYSAVVINAEEAKTLVFGVPHSNSAARLSGEVALYQL